MKIGVLALQGAVREHLWALEACGVETVSVKDPEDLQGLAGLVIPGGESTTVGKLLVRYGLLGPVKEQARTGMGVFGTCTGMILLACDRVNNTQPRLGLMEIEVVRNGFGRQIDSFEADLEIPALGEAPFPAIFIRAPYGIEADPEVEILATFEKKIVLARQGKFLACAFHPELTADLRLHQYFLNLLK